MAFVGQPEQPGGPGTGDDRDLSERVLALDPVPEHRAPYRLLVDAVDLLVSELAIHQQADEPRVAQERAAVGVIGREHHPPGVAAEQK